MKKDFFGVFFNWRFLLVIVVFGFLLQFFVLISSISPVLVNETASSTFLLDFSGGRNIVRLNDGTYLAVFEDSSDGIGCVTSADNGTTWSNANFSSTTGLRYPSIATNGTRIYIVADSGDDLSYNYSDGACPVSGFTLSQLSGFNIGVGAPAIEYDGVNDLYVMCYEEASQDLGFASMSAANIDSWTNLEIKDSITYDGCSISVESDGDIHICVADETSDVVKYLSSDDLFVSTNQDKDLAGSITNVNQCDISSFGSVIGVTSVDQDNGDVYSWISSDGGITFNSSILYGTNFAISNICVDSNSVAQLLILNDSATSGADEIYYNHFTANGYGLIQNITYDSNVDFGRTSILCHNFPDNNKLVNNLLEFLFVNSTGSDVLFSNYSYSVSSAPVIIANATSPSTVYSNTDFVVNLTVTDINNATFYSYVQFYVNNTQVGSEQITLINTNTNSIVGTLGSGNYTKNDELIAEVWVGDLATNTSKVNLTTATVGTLLNITSARIVSSSGNNYTSDNLTLYVNGTVDTNVTYYGEWYKNGEVFVGEVWNVSYDGGADTAYDIALDSSGNVYVTGEANSSFYTIKYDSNGNELFNISTSSLGRSNSIYVSDSGNIYMAGFLGFFGAFDFFVVKYDSNGNQIWNKTMDIGGFDSALGIVGDSSENIYITGNIDNNFYTIKYNSTGSEIWNVGYDSGSTDNALDLSVDSSGNVYVTGLSNNDFLTIKYNSTGSEIWNTTYDSGNLDVPYGVAVDSSGNVYVTGASNGTYFTIKYNSTGSEIWNATYASPVFGDVANDIDVDSSGNVYVTGVANSNYHTIKYDSTGSEIWSTTYDSGGTDQAYGIALDSSGNVYVTGSSSNGDNSDYLTIKYSQLD